MIRAVILISLIICTFTVIVFVMCVQSDLITYVTEPILVIIKL